MTANCPTLNTVRARLSCSFQGQTYELDSVIELDRWLDEPAAPPDFHALLARAAGIDPYSYLYEVLESHAIEFSEATGVAAQGCRGGHFDWPAFVQAARAEREWEVVRAVAERSLGVRDWDAEPTLAAALLAVYRAGRGAGGAP